MRTLQDLAWSFYSCQELTQMVSVCYPGYHISGFLALVYFLAGKEFINNFSAYPYAFPILNSEVYVKTKGILIFKNIQ